MVSWKKESNPLISHTYMYMSVKIGVYIDCSFLTYTKACLNL